MSERERDAGQSADNESVQAKAQDTVSPTPHGAAATQNAADDPGFKRQMQLARQVMRDHRNVLRELAK